MSACYCDYARPEFYHREMRRAKKKHRCSECESAIEPGEAYEHVRGKWDGDVGTCKTCPRCLALRGYVEAHVPCVCWEHGSIIDIAIETARRHGHEAPGLLFGAYRRLAGIIKRQKRTHQCQQSKR